MNQNQTVKAAKRRAKADPDRQGNIVKGRYYGSSVPFRVAARSLQPDDTVKPLNLDARTTRGACA